MLCADGDEDFVGRDEHAAAHEQARLDLLDQQRIVAVEEIGRPAAHFCRGRRLQAALAPPRHRQLRRIDLTVDERIRIALPVVRLDDVALRGHGAPVALRPLRRRRGRTCGCRCRRTCAAGDDLRIDEVAAAALRQQVPFVDEQLVGERDRVARDAELGGKHARRRQRDADGNVAVEDRGDQHLADLRLQAHLAAKRELDQLVPHDAPAAVGPRIMPRRARWPIRRAASGSLYARAIGATKAYHGRLTMPTRCTAFAAPTFPGDHDGPRRTHAARPAARKSRSRSTSTGCRSRRTAISRPIRRWSSAPRACIYWNDRGDKIIDASSGLFCVTAGHGRKEIADAVGTQLRELDFVAPFLRGHPKQFELATRVAELTPGDLNRIFFVNSGSEAVDTAMKVALAYHQARGQGGRNDVRLARARLSRRQLRRRRAVGPRQQPPQVRPGLPGIAHMRHTHLKENFFTPRRRRARRRARRRPRRASSTSTARRTSPRASSSRSPARPAASCRRRAT